VANQFKRGDSVRFKTVGAGVASSRRGVVVRTVDSGRGVRVEVKDKEGRVFRPHLSTVKPGALTCGARPPDGRGAPPRRTT
jgi:hypothetical protein